MNLPGSLFIYVNLISILLNYFLLSNPVFALCNVCSVSINPLHLMSCSSMLAIPWHTAQTSGSDWYCSKNKLSIDWKHWWRFIKSSNVLILKKWLDWPLFITTHGIKVFLCRFQSPCSPSQSEEIHSRVQRILHTQATRRRLSFVSIIWETYLVH